MNLPDVDLSQPGEPPRCPAPAPAPAMITITMPPAAPAPAAPAPADAHTDAAGDAQGDAAGDARTDAGVTPGAGLVPAGELPAAMLAGAELAPWQRAWLTVAHWAGQCWRHICALTTNPRGPWHAQPESLADHDAYRKSRAWIPPGQAGKVIGPAGNAYHLTFGNFGEITGYAWAWLWARPLRISIAAVICGAVAIGFWLG